MANGALQALMAQAPGISVKAGLARIKRARMFYLIVGAMLVASLAVSGIVGSIDVRANPYISSLEIWVTEATSHFAIFLLLPVFPLMLNWAPPIRKTWVVLVCRAAIGLAVFWLSHVVFMWLFRLAVFPPLLGRPYPVELLAPRHLGYEFTKDFFTFATLAISYAGITLIGERRASADTARAADERIVLKSGAAAFYVVADDIISATAAANYVEVRLADRTILARMSLTRLSDLLAQRSKSHIRVHRSHLVNKDKIQTVSPKGDGSVEIEMSDGSVIPGSRRYRQALDGVRGDSLNGDGF